MYPLGGHNPVKVFHHYTYDPMNDIAAVCWVPGELSLICLLVLLHEVLHVVGHVLAEDVVAVGTSVQLLLLVVISGEPLVRVGDVETAISGALSNIAT